MAGKVPRKSTQQESPTFNDFNGYESIDWRKEVDKVLAKYFAQPENVALATDVDVANGTFTHEATSASAAKSSWNCF